MGSNTVPLAPPPGTPYTWVRAGYIGGVWPESQQDQDGNDAYATYYKGDIAEVASYDSQLSAAQVTGEFDVSKCSSTSPPVETDKVTDPAARRWPLSMTR